MYVNKLYSSNQIAEKYGCNPSTILYKLKEWNISIRNKRYNSIYNVDVQYFDKINTEHKAYWLGMIISDGHVNKRNVSLCLSIKDEYHIKKFIYDMKSDAPIKYNKDGNPYIIISSVEIARSLYEKGLNNRKSYGFDFEKLLTFIPNELENHFIRGLFDGDGCIKYYTYNYLHKPQFHFGYTGLKCVCEYISDKLNMNRKLVKEGKVTYTAITRNPQIINNIWEYLYKEATIYLERKYETFKEISMMTFNDYNRDNSNES